MVRKYGGRLNHVPTLKKSSDRQNLPSHNIYSYVISTQPTDLDFLSVGFRADGFLTPAGTKEADGDHTYLEASF